jgi:hypothetical protein
LRDRYPQRHSLKKKLKYTLTHQQGLALWEKGDQTLCGFAEWAGQARSPLSSQRLHELRSDIQSLRPSLQRHQSADSVTHTLRAVFSWLSSPVELDDLVDIVAALQEGTGRMMLVEQEYYESAGQHDILDPQAKLGTRLEQRLYLEKLWQEIITLPLGQRTALLLGLKDSQGDELISLLEYLRIATLSQIAEALAISGEQFSEMWREPIDDTAIARHLGITRQQVINLRLAARRRLARRMEAKPDKR